MQKPYTIGITGGSGSGKTFFLESLSSRFKPDQICLISQDHYYRPIEQQFVDDKGVQNFDLPGSIDREAFLADLRKLKAGQNVLKREYTFNNPVPNPKILEFRAAPILVVEGLFIQYFEEIDQELDLRLFIEAREHIMQGRRILRDQKERGYPLDDVLYRYQYHVMPVYDTLIRPLQQKADLIIPNNHQFATALEVLTTFLKTRLDGVAY
jgi:uridine kinase